MTPSMQTDIVIADDHQMFSQMLKTYLEAQGFNVVAVAANGHEAIREVVKHSPAIIVMDYQMPMLNGIDASKEVLRRSPQTQVVLLTMHDNETFALEALKCGVRGYVLKDQTSSDLVNAIREVIGGAVYLSPRISESVLKVLLSKKDIPTDLLTCREKQVLQLIAEGSTTKEVASLLHISVKTAESHRSQIMNRLDIHNIAGLVHYAIRQGIVEA